MIIKCEECDVSFNLDERLLKPSGSKVRCSKCKKVFVAYPPKQEEETDGVDLDLSGLDTSADDDQFSESAQEASQDEEDGLDFSTLDDMFDESSLTTEDTPSEPEGSELSLDSNDAAPVEEESDELSELTLDLDMADDEDVGGEAEPETEDLELDLDLDLDLDLELDDEGSSTEDDGGGADEELDFSALDELLDEDEVDTDISSDDIELDLDLDDEPTVEENESVTGDDEDLELDLDLDLDSDDESQAETGNIEQEEIDLDELEQTLDMDMLDDAAEGADDSELELELSLEDEMETEADLNEDVDVSDLEDVLEMEDDDVLGSVVDDIDEEDDFELDFDIDDESQVSASDDMELEFEIDDGGSDDSDFGEVTEELEESVTVDLSGSQDESQADVETDATSGTVVEKTSYKRSSGGKKNHKLLYFILFLIVLVVGGGGTYYYIGAPPADQLVDVLKQKAPFLKPLLDKIPVTAVNQIQIEVVAGSIHDEFVKTKDGDILIVTGQLLNNYKDTRINVGIRGMLKAGTKQFATSPIFYGGNIIPKDELANLDLNTINKRLMMNGDKSKHAVKPGGKLPFMIVFQNFKQYPGTTFDYEIIGSTPG